MYNINCKKISNIWGSNNWINRKFRFKQFNTKIMNHIVFIDLIITQ